MVVVVVESARAESLGCPKAVGERTSVLVFLRAMDLAGFMPKKTYDSIVCSANICRADNCCKRVPCLTDALRHEFRRFCKQIKAPGMQTIAQEKLYISMQRFENGEGPSQTL